MKSARSNPQDALVSFSSRGHDDHTPRSRPQNKDSRNNLSNCSVTLARLHSLVRYSECYVLRSPVGAIISKNNLRPRAFIRFYLGSFQLDRRVLHPIRIHLAVSVASDYCQTTLLRAVPRSMYFSYFQQPGPSVHHCWASPSPLVGRSAMSCFAGGQR
jgi:hypothetical protein